MKLCICWLDKKVKVNFKVYNVINQENNNWNTVLPNISRSKDNQTIQLDQLIEHNMRNIFLVKSYTKFDGETAH